MREFYKYASVKNTFFNNQGDKYEQKTNGGSMGVKPSANGLFRTGTANRFRFS
jgi:hypothetical protein